VSSSGVGSELSCPAQSPIRVVDALTDPERRGLAFVAGTVPNRLVAEWRDIVELLLDDTVGLANAWVLSADATDKFNYLVGRSHEATAGFGRTYLPDMDVGNPLDGERHRFLTSGRIEPSPERAISRILGHRAREQMIGARLPVALRDLDRMLRRDVDTALLDELSPPVTPTSSAPLAPVRPSHPPAPAFQDSPSPKPAIPDYREHEDNVEPASPAALFESQLVGILSELLGTSEVTVDSLAQLGAMAKTAQRAEAAREGIRARLEELQDAVEEAELARDIIREELNAEQLEHVSADEERIEAERRLRFTRSELARLGRADLAWSEPELDIRDIRPDTFTELMERWNDFKYVVFTGDKGLTEDLDRHGNAGTWAGKAWEALLALDDYARISNLESYGRDVSGFLADTPQGCRSFSANRHTARESEGVQNNPRFRRRENCLYRYLSTPLGGFSWVPISKLRSQPQ
jgi:hypothetical protein